MANSLRELRRRRTSAATTKKITRAMELVAASRIVKAQQRERAAWPYTNALAHALSALVTDSEVDHPLLHDYQPPRRSAMLLITSDRGMAGAYSANAIKRAAELETGLRDEGQEVVQYITGAKGVGYFDFRDRPVEQSWTGFSDAPQAVHAREIGEVLLAKFLAPYEEGGVDQIHIVGTRFVSMLTQQPRAVRLLPLVIEDAEEDDTAVAETIPYYEFEPSPEKVLDKLLPLYINNRIHTALLTCAASELASRQRAMKSATDNADQLIENLTRQANQARQAEITQEISEIVGGAAALAES